MSRLAFVRCMARAHDLAARGPGGPRRAMAISRGRAPAPAGARIRYPSPDIGSALPAGAMHRRTRRRVNSAGSRRPRPECELLDRRRFTQAAARLAVFDHLDGWYNPPAGAIRPSATCRSSPLERVRWYRREAESTSPPAGTGQLQCSDARRHHQSPAQSGVGQRLAAGMDPGDGRSAGARAHSDATLRPRRGDVRDGRHALTGLQLCR